MIGPEPLKRPPPSTGSALSPLGAGRTAISLQLCAEDKLLPTSLFWLYLVAPIAAAPLLVDDLFGQSAQQAGWALLTLYVPFLGIPLPFHALYRWVMPGVLRKLRPGPPRYLAHAVAIVSVATVTAAVLYPLDQSLCADGKPLLSWIAKCVVISAAIVAPALVVSELRRVARNTERIAQAERQAALEAQLQALQARTNPHFFFNTLNTIATLIPENPELAERTLERLADIFRYALDSSRTRAVPLSREVEVVRDYLAVQAARFGDRLRYTVELDPEAASVPVPPLLLQPLVENAILHGVSQRAEGGHVEVLIRREGAKVTISVGDNGPGPGRSNHHGSGTSVGDLSARLRMTYGDQSSLELGARPGGGFLVRLWLPSPTGAAAT
jgi:two-component system sensor histidine kinase AlgZ